MSVPAFAWALEQGERLNLSTNARLLLAVLANRANGEMVTWPSQETLVRWTGIKLRTIRILTHTLVEAGLIEVSRAGRSLTYRVLRDPSGAPKHRQQMPVSRRRKPAANAGVQRTKPAADAGMTPVADAGIGTQTPAANAGHTGSKCRSTPAADAAKTTTETTNETEARVRAQEAREEIREKEGAASTSHDPFNDVLDQIAAGRRRSLAAVEGGATMSGPVEADDGCVGSAATAALVAGMARSMFTNYPPRAPRLTRDEQVRLLARPALRDVCLAGEALRLARERAGIFVREAVAAE